jgi:hypothetical protein
MTDVIREEWLAAEATRGKDTPARSTKLSAHRIDITEHVGKIVVYDDPELRDMILSYLQSRTKLDGS